MNAFCQNAIQCRKTVKKVLDNLIIDESKLKEDLTINEMNSTVKNTECILNLTN